MSKFAPVALFVYNRREHVGATSAALERNALAADPSSGYGEDQDLTYPFPSIIKRAIAHAGEEQLTVWGTGDQMRDFIHIEDCVDGVLATMDKIDDADALNLSTGIYTSFKQFARMAAEAVGYSPEVIGLSSQPAWRVRTWRLHQEAGGAWVRSGYHV